VTSQQPVVTLYDLYVVGQDGVPCVVKWWSFVAYYRHLTEKVMSQ